MKGEKKSIRAIVLHWGSNVPHSPGKRGRYIHFCPYAFIFCEPPWRGKYEKTLKKWGSSSYCFNTWIGQLRRADESAGSTGLRISFHENSAGNQRMGDFLPPIISFSWPLIWFTWDLNRMEFRISTDEGMPIKFGEEWKTWEIIGGTFRGTNESNWIEETTQNENYEWTCTEKLINFHFNPWHSAYFHWRIPPIIFSEVLENTQISIAVSIHDL